MSRYVVGLNTRVARRVDRAGGKGASLAQLCARGFTVPPGFVITCQAFRGFLDHYGIGVLARRMDWTEPDLARIRELLTACRIPERMARTIGRAYRRIGGKVAVRSSMVGEDARTASCAGQLDTVLNVQGEQAVLRAVRRCWASMFSWRLVQYLAMHEELVSDALMDRFSIAVVVQRMVDAECAGVAFSADPVSGQSCVVIEAVCGLGEALVQGLVEPDRYIVDGRGVLLEATPANEGVSVLREEQTIDLAEVVRRVAGQMQAPQDVEWAWDGDCFQLLQSRPITSLVGESIYSSRMVSDMAPGLIMPLVWSTNTVGMATNVFRRVFTALIGPNEVDFSRLVKRIHSRAYTNMTLLGELLRRVGLPDNFMEMMARDEQARRRHPPVSLRTLRAALRLIPFVWRHARMAGEIDAFVERHSRDLEPYRCADWSLLAPEALLTRLDRLMRLHADTQWFVFLGPINMMVRNRMLSRLVERHAPNVVPSDLIRGLVGLKALEPNNELQRIAAQVGKLGAEAQHLMAGGDDAAIRSMLAGSEAGRCLAKDVDAFINVYGFLSTNGTDFAGTPWIETPGFIWRLVARLANNRVASTVESNQKIREEARRRVRESLGALQRMHFDRLLASTTAYIDLRERTSLLMSEDAYQMRRIFRALAEGFVQAGTLEKWSDVFYLTHDEIRRLVQGGLGADQVRHSVRDREAAMSADAGIELPETICGDVLRVQPSPEAEAHEYLTGISGSSGLARGYARIVLDLSQAPLDLTQTDILVVPFTDVSWTPLFAGVGGVVAETGGQLSHTSIVAREYGLPAVVSVKKATRVLRSGQAVTVDGDRGRVYLSHVIDV